MYYGVSVASQRYHGQESLTYSSDESLAMGQLVSVELQHQKVLGVIDAVSSKPKFKTKNIVRSWAIILPPQSLKLMHWLAQYYPAPLGAITELFTPPPLKKEMATDPRAPSQPNNLALPKLTSEQEQILSAIDLGAPTSTLLHGDTGSGKTRIYLELARRVVEKNQSVILLTPEIGLTKPLLETFQNVFGDKVLVTHSEMTPAQRREVWLRSYSESGVVIIGPRSALFAPLQDIGLIVMDECHDGAYKQEQAPYYQTSRVAAKLAQLHKATFVMGSATPLLSDYYTFLQKKLPILRMQQTALPTSTVKTTVTDLKNKSAFTKSIWLSDDLLKAIGNALEQKEQSLLFLNRRGSARLVLCNDCGWQALCPHCDVPLTYHHDSFKMVCHSCDYSGAVPSSCPVCGQSELIFRNIGTKSLEAEIIKLFPQAKVARFDRDTLKPLRLNQQHEALQTGKIDILIGTQSIVKGFDLPKLSVVGIIQADSGLQIPDFSSSERTFQLISQVSGRIGRGHRESQLFVQTFDPDSKIISYALKKDYREFYAKEIIQRELYGFTPFNHLLKISASRSTSQSAKKACQKLANELRTASKTLIVDGPSPRFIEKVAGKYRWHLIVKSKSRKILLSLIAQRSSNFTYDIDPSDLL